MKKRTLAIIIAGLLAFIWYKGRKSKSVSTAVATNSNPSSSIAKEEPIPVVVAPEPTNVINEMPTSMPGTIYATYVDIGVANSSELRNGDTVEVLKTTDRTYVVHKILGNSTYVSGSIELPIDALIF